MIDKFKNLNRKGYLLHRRWRLKIIIRWKLPRELMKVWLAPIRHKKEAQDQ